MKIIVLLKEVPDTYGERKLDLETGLADREFGETVIDEIGERSLELALKFADANSDAEVVLLSLARGGATDTLRKGLAIGAHSAIHICDDELLGADIGLTAESIAAAIRKTGFDLIIAGNTSTDGAGGILPAMLAELLKVPHATSLSEVQIASDSVSGWRTLETGVQEISSGLPAVISITEASPSARFPNFKGIMAAKKKPIQVLSLADIGVSANDPAAARSIMLAVAEKPSRGAGVKIVDEGNAGEKLASFLIENRLV